jgi:hypothetical protein
MIWRDPKNHSDDCYCCCCDVKGYNSKNKKVILYRNIPSALRPVVHGPEVPVLQPTYMLENVSTNSSDSGGDYEEFQCHTEESENRQLFTQSELKYVIRDLGMPREKAELLGSRLKQKHLLAAGKSMCRYRNREQEFTSYFLQDGGLVYCCNIPRLMKKFGVDYKLNEWRLFIDSSKRRLKAVLFAQRQQLRFITYRPLSTP